MTESEPDWAAVSDALLTIREISDALYLIAHREERSDINDLNVSLLRTAEELRDLLDCA